MMKYIVLTLMAVMLFPLTARAELTEQDIKSFNDNYVKMFASCDTGKIVSYLDTHYAPGYTMQLKLPNGEVRQATREDLKRMAAQGVEMMKGINQPGTDCKPDMEVGEMKLSGNTGVVQITQHEQMTLPQNGQMVTVEAYTGCNHKVEKVGNTVKILQSKCLLYQK